MFLPLCVYCYHCIYFRDIGVGFCTSPDRFNVDDVKKDKNCPLFDDGSSQLIQEKDNDQDPEDLISYYKY